MDCVAEIDMTKAQLYNRIADLMCAENRTDPTACKANALKALQDVDAWVAEVIGKNDKTGHLYHNNDLRIAKNYLRRTQRKRAEIPAALIEEVEGK
jgi:hypothetical protein